MALNEQAVLSIRREFSSLMETQAGKAIIFFDGPGGTQVHGSVIEAMGHYLTTANSNAHGSFLHSRRTDEAIIQARRAMTDFLNASRPEEIVFGPNMTTLTFRLSQAIGETLKPGDEIVVTRLDHDANVSPWLALQEKGVVIRHVDFEPAECTLNMKDMERAINRRTKVVALGYASNAVGTVNDIRSVIDMAHEAGAWVYIDAVHYAPHGPIDVEALGCDFLVCSAYKFFGPHLGVLFGRYDLLGALPARKVAPAGDDPPDKFETGTNNFEGICGASAAVGYLASIGQRFGDDFMRDYPGFAGRRLHLKTGMSAIRAYEKTLARALIAGLQKVPGIRIYGMTDEAKLDRRVPTISFTMGDLTPGEIARKLDAENIYVWDGHFYAVAAIERLGLANRGGVVRVGLCHYNTLEEVETLLSRLSTMRRG
ncbi:MAG: cysteine desulfurase-like protein [Desulfobacterales bacterium]|nr:cysteine desulfurase-like protein [Desulfobacterales bacterium]